MLPLPRLALYESWHRLRWPSVEKATGRVDVVHATSLAVPPRSAPLVVTIHDLAFLSDPSHFTRRGVSFFRRGLEIARRDADLIICPSQATARHLLQNGFGEDRVRVVPMGVDMERARPEEIESTRSRYGLGKPYIMWTGTIEPRKNLRGLLEAFVTLGCDHDLVLVGPRGWNEDLEELRRSMLGNREKVKMLGFIPNEDLGPLYAGAEAFVFPSLFEGFGLPVIEAMTQGTPVVTSMGTSTEELGGDVAILVDPRDTKDISRGLDLVLTDAGVRERAKTEGPKRAAGYSWVATADGLIEGYREVSG